MIKRYFTVSGYAENTIIIERSKFIGYVSSAENENQAKEFIEKIKKQNSLATHNCYAYIACSGQAVKFSDDGEPSGTAGMPILEVIKNKNLLNCVVVVSRYFGGIKLGTGGLARAYSSCCAESLDKGGIAEFVLCKELNITVSYENFAATQKYIESKKILVISTDYGINIFLKIAVFIDEFQSFIKDLTDFMQGKVQICEGNEKFFSRI